MEKNGGDEVMFSESHEAGCSEATVEIKIKTLDSQTYTLRVDKCVPVPALKEQIASVTGVVSEQQRLICRGKVLKDDQLLSAYHVEDGHTLHLVVRQPIASSSESLPDHMDLASSAGDIQGSRGPSVLVGTFNISEQGDGNFPDLGRVVSAVLSSFGVSGFGSGIEELERLSQMATASGARDSSRQHLNEATTGNQTNPLSVASSATPLEPFQLPVIPDSLTTLSQYLNHLRHEFITHGASGNGSQPTLGHGTSIRESVLATYATSELSRLPGPSSLAEVMRSMRQLLIEQAAEGLSDLVGQLEDHANVTDPSTRTGVQLNILRSGVLFQNLGASLLELGRTAMMLRLGQTPDDAVVNSGPAVFISPSGPNPIMVQPHPFQSGASFGAIPVGTVQTSPPAGGTLGSGSISRNIDIRIRTGSLIPSVVNNREQSGSDQPPSQTNTAFSGIANSINQAARGASGESEVRIVPIRTMVAAIPTIRRTPSGSSPSSVGLVLPVLARVQHVTSGNLSGARGSQSSSELSSGEVDAQRQPVPESDGQEENTGIFGTEVNNHPGGGTQSGGSSEPCGRVDQLLRSTFPAEQFHVGSVNSQTNSAMVPEEMSGSTVHTEEAAARVSDEGAFLSNVLHQIMPFISQNMAIRSDGVSLGGDISEVASNRQASSTQVQ